MNIQELKEIRNEMVGYKYRHFKGGLYLVTDIAIHTENEDLVVIYNSVENPDLVWCRPLNMFVSKVDHVKYPDVKQEMRFERIEGVDEK